MKKGRGTPSSYMGPTARFKVSFSGEALIDFYGDPLDYQKHIANGFHLTAGMTNAAATTRIISVGISQPKREN